MRQYRHTSVISHSNTPQNIARAAFGRPTPALDGRAGAFAQVFVVLYGFEFGFEVVEDLLYMIDDASGIAFTRAAFPGHCIFGIYMGYYFGQAKTLELAGETKKAAKMRRKGVLAAAGLHGLYDFLCFYIQDAPEVLSVLLVFGLIALMVILNVTAYKNIKRYAHEDTEV